MATAVETKPTRTPDGEHRFLLRGVGWEGYEALLRMVDGGRVRVTYDRGDAELMSPSQNHEFYKKVIGWMLETAFEELDIPYQAAGSTTWRKQADGRGLEADECFYLSNLELVHRKRNQLDLTIDPAPDLAVEVEISRSALDRMGVYAALGISEVWRFDGENLVIGRLEPEGRYAEVPVSPRLPELPPGEIVRWIRLAEATANRAEWNRRFRDWVRAELRPKRAGR